MMSEYTTVTEQEVDLVEDLEEEQHPPAAELAEAEPTATPDANATAAGHGSAPVETTPGADPTVTAEQPAQTADTMVNGAAVDHAVSAEEKEEGDAPRVKPVQAGLRPGLRAGLSR